MSEKRKWEREEALAVAMSIEALLRPACEEVLIAGSIRRRKPLVGDVEILFVPRFRRATIAEDLFVAPSDLNETELVIDRLLAAGVIERRLNVKGGTAWGEKNKLAVHCATGIPLDLFTATRENWWNYVVCRTGGAENNVAIASAAQRMGWKWNPYGSGFSRGGPLAGPGRQHVVTSEREVFEFVGLPYLEPEERR